MLMGLAYAEAPDVRMLALHCLWRGPHISEIAVHLSPSSSLDCHSALRAPSNGLGGHRLRRKEGHRVEIGGEVPASDSGARYESVECASSEESVTHTSPPVARRGDRFRRKMCIIGEEQVHP